MRRNFLTISSPPHSCGYRKFSFQWLKLAPFHTHVSVHRKDKNSPGKVLYRDALDVIHITSATVLLETFSHRGHWENVVFNWIAMCSAKTQCSILKGAGRKFSRHPSQREPSKWKRGHIWCCSVRRCSRSEKRTESAIWRKTLKPKKVWWRNDRDTVDRDINKTRAQPCDDKIAEWD